MRRERSRWAALLGAILVVGAVTAGGCSAHKRAVVATPGQAAPSYEEVSKRYNERTARLGRVWARSVFRIDYTDQEDRSRREQLEGYLQYVAPNRLALSGGKSITDTLFWLGCDEQRFWWFELGEAKRALVGRHENVGKECCREVGLPARPMDIIAMLGVTPLPSAGARVDWSTDRRWVAVEVAQGAGPGAGATQYFLDAETMEPGVIRLVDRAGMALDPSGEATGTIVWAELSNYEPVTLRDAPPGAFPRIATRVSVKRPDSEDEIRLTLTAMSDGRERDGRLAADSFRFEALVKALHPRAIDVLDSQCPTPAYNDALSAAERAGDAPTGGAASRGGARRQ